MGQDQSKGQEQTTYEDLLKKYEKIETIEHDVQVLKEKGSDKLIGLREFNLTDEIEFNKILSKFKPKLNLDHVNLVKVHHVFEKKEAQFCSTFYKVQVVFELVQNTLQQEIANRLDLGQNFAEEEIWNILTQCILGVCYLYSNNLIHTNVRPSTILITTEGIVKVTDPVLLSQPSLYVELLSNSSNIASGVYLAPELLNSAYEQEANPSYDKQKSDVFSLGMTVLHAATLRPLDDVYDYKNCQIDESALQDRLNQVQQQYGTNLYNFLRAMLEFNVNQRQDIFVFDQILNQNQGQGSNPIFDSPAKLSDNQPEEILVQQQQVQEYQLQQLKLEQERLQKAQEEQIKQLQYKQQLELYELQQKELQIQQQYKKHQSMPSSGQVIPPKQPAERAPANPSYRLEEETVKRSANGTVVMQHRTTVSSSNVNNFINEPQQQQRPTAPVIPPVPVASDRKYSHQVPDEKPIIVSRVLTEVNSYSPIPPSPQQPEQPKTNNYSAYPTQQQQPYSYQNSVVPSSSISTPSTTNNYPEQLNVQYKLSQQPTDYQKTTYTAPITGSTYTPTVYTQTVTTTTQNNAYQLPSQQNSYSSSAINSYKLPSETAAKPVIPSYTASNPTGLSSTNTYQVPENNFTYTPGPTTSFTPSITTQSTAVKNNDIDEAIKRSAPPPPYKNPDIIQFTQLESQVLPQIPSSNVTQAQPSNFEYKQSEEIEAILSKYRIKQQQEPVLPEKSTVTTTNYTPSIYGNNPSSSGNTYISATSNTTTTTQPYTLPPQQSALSNLPAYAPTSQYTSQYQPLYSDNKNFNDQVAAQLESLSINQNPTVPAIQNQPPSAFISTTHFVQREYAPVSYSNESQQQKNTYEPYNQTSYQVNNQQQYAGDQFKSYQTQREYVIENYSNNSKYEGEKLNGMRDGRGKFYYPDGGLFEGDWQENKMHGKGVLRYASGKPAFDGDWVEDKFEGFGILYNENPAQLVGQFNYSDFDNVDEYWTRYEGQFKDDNKEGEGTLYLSNGEKFVGQFFKDYVSGDGVFYTILGQPIQGNWYQNKMNGSQ